MAFSDILWVVGALFLLIIVGNTLDYAMDAVRPHYNDSIPANTSAKIDSAWTNNQQFFDGSAAALFLIFAVLSIVLTIFLASHPVLLVIWIFVNLVVLFVYDTFDLFLVQFMASSLNTGAMDSAYNFFHGDLPKAVAIINMIAGLILFGKRGVE